MIDEEAMSKDLEDAAVVRLHGLISQEAIGIGPYEVDEEDEPVLDKPLAGAVLQEWVLVMSWADPASGRSVITRATSPRLARHHENGLLHEALYSFD
jgi:hypothetical protein